MEARPRMARREEGKKRRILQHLMVLKSPMMQRGALVREYFITMLVMVSERRRI